MLATRENYLYGCTLLNLHGLYYTTYGSHWEWAPPCYHFRMPYWAHMDVFLGYFDRLSYLMSQGHHVCDVAVIYPVAPYEAEMNGRKSCGTAFDLGQRLMAAGINFEYIDNDSLARAEVANGKLIVRAAGASYQALVFPNMDAVRWESIEKAAAFARAGGKVFAVGVIPSASDRAGRNDAKLAAMNDLAFKADRRLARNGQVVNAIRNAFVQDVRGLGRTLRALHRKVGPRDVYLVMDARPGTVVEFRTRGAVELWDPWTGKVRPLRVVKRTATGTQVELPLEPYEAQIVVFTPGRKHVNPPKPDERPMLQKTLPAEWTVTFVPTMDNTYGDFRMPATAENKLIGVEARRFGWARETAVLAKTAMLPKTDDHSWSRTLHGYGPQFYVLGPVPNDVDIGQLDAELAKLKRVDPSTPVKVSGRNLTWRTYDFSWRYGKEGDLGHQGYHGLKHRVTDDFICLGRTTRGLNETRYTDAKRGKRYYLWTSATTPKALSATILVSRGAPADKSHTSPVITPSAVYVNGVRVGDLAQPISLRAGANPTLIRYDRAGRGHFVVRRQDRPVPKKRAPLAMRWHNDPGVIPFDVYAGSREAEWFRFLSAPGTTAIRVQARGQVRAWINGEPMANRGNGRFEAVKPAAAAAVVALRVMPLTGRSGGAVIPEPITVETSGAGVMILGDWSRMGILNNYSGGVRYRTTVTLTKDQAGGKVDVDLGQVAATAEVHVNGKKVGVRVAPPWRLDVTGFLKTGRNTLEVLVYNTLANHYQTIPSRYRGKPLSGLIGPVRLLSRDWKSGQPVSSIKRASPPARPGLKAPRTVSTVGGIQIATSGGSVRDFNRIISARDNVLRQPGLLKSMSGPRSHNGGGSGFSALFNGTAGNRNGGERTENDGHTFVGMAEGNTLEIVFDPAKAPKGVPIYAIRSYAAHGDARASQKYTVYAAKAPTPDQFVRIADVSYDSRGGLNEVAITSAKGRPLAGAAGRLRFVFHSGAVGFNVYREIAVFGAPTPKKDR